MFNKKFALLLTSIHAWLIMLFSIGWVFYALFTAGDVYGVPEGIGTFLGLMFAGFLYMSVWYLIIFLIRKSINK